MRVFRCFAMTPTLSDFNHWVNAFADFTSHHPYCGGPLRGGFRVGERFAAPYLRFWIGSICAGQGGGGGSEPGPVTGVGFAEFAKTSATPAHNVDS